MKSIKLFIGLLLVFSAMFIACEEDESQSQFSISDEYPISIYIGMQAEYSLWKEVMTKGDLYASFNVAGAYTMLVPDNESLSKLFEVKPLVDWTYEECRELVFNHSFASEISRESMREGALNDVTLNGNLVASKFGQGDGTQTVILNQNVILEGNPFEATNGFVYGVNGVLTSLERDVVGMLAERGDCSIFIKALETTGIKARMAKADTILWNGDVNRLTWTVFAVSDSIYNLNDITSYDQLQAHYTQNDAADIKNELTNSSNGLFQHISQHILDEEVYTNSMITFRTDWGRGSNADPIIPTVNYYACIGNTNCLQTGDINGVLVINPNMEKTDYTLLLSGKFNLITNNGCIHYVNRAVDGVNDLYKEMIQTVFSDVKRNDSIEEYRAGAAFNLKNRPIEYGKIAEWRWSSTPEDIDLYYMKSGSEYYGGGDLVNFNLGGVNEGWVEFDVCPIPAGKYKLHSYVWTGDNGAGTYNLYIDDELVGTAGKVSTAGHFALDYSSVVTFKRGGRHTIRYEYVSGAGDLRIAHCSFTPQK